MAAVQLRKVVKSCDAKPPSSMASISREQVVGGLTQGGLKG
jgi:hypothetical protein